MRTGGGDDRRAAELEQGQRLGRYLILAALGAGPSGAVYAAYDPEADRKVALKLLHPAGEGSARAEALASEARNVARLANPHVVRVLDVGRHGGACFVVMEYVRGRPLDAWLREHGAHWRALTELLRQAGRGLAAGHRAGLIHRGLKPSNILVGDDGLVRLTDFGLTRTLEAEPRATLAAGPEVIGCLAPEQLAGGRADALSDQWALCAVLYEALYGVRPFGGDGPEELLEAIAARRLQTPVRSAIVPAWLREALLRGLAADPARRFPSVDALLERLAPAPRRRGRAWLAGGLVALGGLGALLALWLGAPAGRDCPEVAREVGALWADARQAACQSAFAASGRVHAPATWERVRARLSGWAGRWGEARVQACLAAGDPGAAPGDAAEALGCLRIRRAEFDALTGVLAAAEGPDVDRAALALEVLGEPSRCLAPALAPVGPGAGAATRVQEVRAELGRARALRAMGRPGASLEIAERALEAAAGLGVAGEARLERALSAAAVAGEGRGDALDADLEEALWEALAEGDLPSAAAAAVARIELASDGAALARRVRAAEALTRALRAVRPVEAQALSARLAVGRGRALTRLGEAAEAAAALAQAVELGEALRAPGAPPPQGPARALAEVLGELGREAEALAAWRRALATAEEGLGPAHPALLEPLTALAEALLAAGELQESLSVSTRAVALAEALLGPEHPRALRPALARGRALARLGQAGEARQILERALGAEGPDEAGEVAALGLEVGDLDAALEGAGRALVARRDALGERHPDTGRLHLLLAEVLRLRGELGAAEREYVSGLTTLEGALGAEHPRLARALLGLGLVRLVGGRAPEAVPTLERALALLERAAVEPRLLPEARFALARALQRTRPAERARIQALADAARVGFAAGGDAEAAAEVARFLAASRTGAP